MNELKLTLLLLEFNEGNLTIGFDYVYRSYAEVVLLHEKGFRLYKKGEFLGNDHKDINLLTSYDEVDTLLKYLSEQ